MTRLSEISLQRLLYQSSFIIDEPEPELSNNAFGSIDNEESWNQLVDRLNKDNLGLSGLAGIGLSLVQNVNNNCPLPGSNKDMVQVSPHFNNKV
jgi:hypothetical protein